MCDGVMRKRERVQRPESDVSVGATNQHSIALHGLVEIVRTSIKSAQAQQGR